MTFSIVSDNKEPVELAPSWMVIQDAGQGTFIQEIVQGWPSHSGPLMTFFSAEDETGVPVFMCSYHRIMTIKPYTPNLLTEYESPEIAN